MRLAAEFHGWAGLYVPELSFVAEEDGGVVYSELFRH